MTTLLTSLRCRWLGGRPAPACSGRPIRERARRPSGRWPAARNPIVNIALSASAGAARSQAEVNRGATSADGRFGGTLRDKRIWVQPPGGLRAPLPIYPSYL